MTFSVRVLWILKKRDWNVLFKAKQSLQNKEKMAGKISIVAALMVCIAGVVHSHTYYLGSCPRVEPVNDFDMSKVKLEDIFNNP